MNLMSSAIAKFRNWLRGDEPASSASPVPAPRAVLGVAIKELPVSILDNLSLFSKLAPIVTTAVQVVEVVAPNAPGVEKLSKAKAAVAAAVEKASDIKQSASELWDVIEPLIEMVVAALKTSPAQPVDPATAVPPPGIVS